MGKTIVVSNHKGGPGKTTLSMQIMDIASNSEYGYGLHVLLIDADPQGSLSDSLCEQKCPGLYAFIISKLDARMHINDRLDFISCTDAGSINEALKQEGEILPEMALADLLDEVKDQYDLIIIDCPPEDDFLNNLAYMAADEVIVPITSDEYSLKGLIQLAKRMQKIRRFNPDIKIGGIVINRVNMQTNAYKDTLASAKEMADYYHTKVFTSVIANSIIVDEAQKNKQSVTHYAPSSKVARQLKCLTAELLKDQLDIQGGTS